MVRKTKPQERTIERRQGEGPGHKESGHPTERSARPSTMIQWRVAASREQQPVGTKPFHAYVLDNGNVWTEFYHVEPGYLLRFPGLADFEVSEDGMTIVAHPMGGTDSATLEHLYLNQLVPLALSRQGRPAFHASVVTAQGGCIAFLGRAGMGKSTLAASFALAGEAFLGDDSLIVDELGGIFLAVPGHGSLRLWEDSVGALTRQDPTRTERVSYSSKARLFAGGSLTHGDAPLPLCAAYVLRAAGASQVTIQPLAGADRHLAWVENSFVLDIDDQDLLTRHFGWTRRIAESVPTFALDYPRVYDRLAEVRRAVRQHTGGLGERHG